MTTRDKTLTVRVSEHEREAIRDRAAANGIDVSEHVRRAAMSYGVTTPTLPVIEAEVVKSRRRWFRRFWRAA